MLVAVSHCRIEVNWGDFQHFRRALYNRISKRERERDEIRSNLWSAVELQLKNIRHELLTQRNVLKHSVTILALRCLMVVLALAESSSTTAAEIETVSTPTLAEYNH